MIDLRLSEKETRCLENALARRASEMINELVHTTDRAAHAELKASYEEIDALCRRVTDLLKRGAATADERGRQADDTRPNRPSA